MGVECYFKFQKNLKTNTLKIIQVISLWPYVKSGCINIETMRKYAKNHFSYISQLFSL